MARLARLTLPGLPHHLIQRGNNRQAIFQDAADRERLLLLLAENARRFELAVHAYVLMDNHFHLLVTPSTVDGLPKCMQAVGRSYVRFYNDRHGRTGTLWEGRYRSTVIETERYLLTCMAYLDLNPVRAGMVMRPADYPWSSHGHYIGNRHEAYLTPHPLVWSLGNTPFAREAAYAELVQAGIPDTDRITLTDATLHGWAIGEETFVQKVQDATVRRVVKRMPGRPRALPSD